MSINISDLDKELTQLKNNLDSLNKCVQEYNTLKTQLEHSNKVMSENIKPIKTKNSTLHVSLSKVNQELNLAND